MPAAWSAQNVGGEIVSDENGALRVEVGNLLERTVEKGPGGLIGAQLLGDKELFKIAGDPGAFQTGALHRSGAVAGQKQAIFGREIFQNFRRAFHKKVTDSQKLLILFPAERGIRLHAQLRNR